MKVNIKGGLGWIRGLRREEHDMSLLVINIMKKSQEMTFFNGR